MPDKSLNKDTNIRLRCGTKRRPILSGKALWLFEFYPTVSSRRLTCRAPSVLNPALYGQGSSLTVACRLSSRHIYPVGKFVYLCHFSHISHRSALAYFCNLLCSKRQLQLCDDDIKPCLEKERAAG